MKIDILPSECQCEKCSLMCHAPCCATLNEIKELIEKGYAHRLMLDDLPGGPIMIKPALKGYEGKKSPWEVASQKGCSFWKENKCELHNLGLKPTQGKLAHHSLNSEQFDKIGNYVAKTWENEKKSQEVIELWIKINEEIPNN